MRLLFSHLSSGLAVCSTASMALSPCPKHPKGAGVLGLVTSTGASVRFRTARVMLEVRAASPLVTCWLPITMRPALRLPAYSSRQSTTLCVPRTYKGKQAMSGWEGKGKGGKREGEGDGEGEGGGGRGREGGGGGGSLCAAVIYCYITQTEQLLFFSSRCSAAAYCAEVSAKSICLEGITRYDQQSGIAGQQQHAHIQCSCRLEVEVRWVGRHCLTMTSELILGPRP